MLDRLTWGRRVTWDVAGRLVKAFVPMGGRGRRARVDVAPALRSGRVLVKSARGYVTSALVYVCAGPSVGPRFHFAAVLVGGGSFAKQATGSSRVAILAATSRRFRLFFEARGPRARNVSADAISSGTGAGGL